MRLKNLLFVGLILGMISCGSEEDPQPKEEDVTITVQDFSVTIAENPTAGQQLGTIQASASSGTVTFSIQSQTPSGAFSVGSSGALAVADPTLFDFESRTSLTAVVQVSAGSTTETVDVTATLTDVDDAMVSTNDFSVTIAENPMNGQVLGTVSATTDNGTLSYAIGSSTPAGVFAIDAASGELSVADASLFDFETNPTITGVVEVSVGSVMQNANITITLTDVDDAMITVSDFAVTIDENPEANQVLGTIQASTDHGDMVFQLVSINPAGAFVLNGTTLELTVGDASLYDFETNPTLTAVVQVSVGSVTESANITVILNDVAESHTGPAFDEDGDGLIDIYNFDQLNAIRLDMNGDGQADDLDNISPYMAAFPSIVDASAGPYTGYELMNDLNFNNTSDYMSEELQTIFTTEGGWSPIGTSSTDAYTADFEGNGFIISNLFVNRSGFNRQGFFGAISVTSEVRNLGIDNANVTARFSSGVLIGSSEGVVTKCFVTGSLTGVQGRIGGLIGTNTGSVSECYAKVDISASAADIVGGLIGFDAGSGQTITNCYATGSVEALAPVGGLIGGNSSSVSNSYSTGSITSSSNSAQIGGLIGGEWNSTSDSYWDTDTSNMTTSGGGTGQTTSDLQSPTSNTGIYANWDSSIWDFGTSSEYPVLKQVAGGVDLQRQ